MLTRLDIGESNPTPMLSFDLVTATPDTPMKLKSVSGLTSTSVGLFLGEFAREGGYYQGRRANRRNIVFQIELCADYKNGGLSVDAQREKIYKAFHAPNYNSSGGNVYQDGPTLIIHDDRVQARQVRLYAENIEQELFSRETVVQVSCLTLGPYLEALIPDLYLHPTAPNPYQGSAEAGFQMEFSVLTDSPDRIRVEDPTQGRAMIFEKPTGSGAFAPGDRIKFDTVPGRYRVQYKANGTSTWVDKLSYLRPESRWLVLRPDSANSFTISGSYDDVPRGTFRRESMGWVANWWGI